MATLSGLGGRRGQPAVDNMEEAVEELASFCVKTGCPISMLFRTATSGGGRMRIAPATRT
jgi:hypothetical protein